MTVPPQNITMELTRVEARIPPFWKEDMEIWFAKAESQFFSARINPKETKFNAIVESLDASVLQQVKQAVV